MNWRQELYRAWRFHYQLQLTTLVVLTGVFAVIGVFWSVQKNLHQSMLQFSETVKIVIYLKESVDEKSAGEMLEALRIDGSFASVDYVTKEQAAQKFLDRMGRLAPNLFSDPEFANPLPASVEISLKRSPSSSGLYEELKATSERLSKMAGVDEVSYGQGWIENYAGLVSVLTQSSWFLICLLLAGGTLIVGNAIQSSVAQRRDEIAVLELIGATAARIRRPFVIEGTVLGGLAAALSMVLCFGVYQWHAHLFGSGLKFLGLASILKFLNPLELTAFVLFGAIVGAVGSYLCVRKITTGWSAVEGVE